MIKRKSKRRRKQSKKKTRSRISGNVITPNARFRLAYKWRAKISNLNTPRII